MIQPGDYVEGFERYGGKVRRMKGWVDDIFPTGRNTRYYIQADDNWKGARGTILHSEYGALKRLEDTPRPQREA